MGKFCQVNMGIWQDSFILELDSMSKTCFLYLLTNPKSSQCGIFEMSVRQIHNETGIPMELIETQIAYFCKAGKLLLDEETHEFMIVHWMRHHVPMNPSVLSGVMKELAQVRSLQLKDRWTYLQTHGGNLPITSTQGVDTSPTPAHIIDNNLKEQQQHQEQPRTEDKITGVNVLGYSSVVLSSKEVTSLPTLEEQDQTVQKGKTEEDSWDQFQSDLTDQTKNKTNPKEGVQSPEEVIIRYFNQQFGTEYKYSNPSINKLILAQLALGFTVDDFCKVIDQKKIDWLDTDYQMHLTPYCLFGEKFETYLRQPSGRDHKPTVKRIPISKFTNKTLRKV